MEKAKIYCQKNPGSRFGKYLLGIKDIHGKERTGLMNLKGNSLDVEVLGEDQERILVLLPKAFGSEPAWINSNYILN